MVLLDSLPRPGWSLHGCTHDCISHALLMTFTMQFTLPTTRNTWIHWDTSFRLDPSALV